MVDKEKSARVDPLERRLSVERQLHEQEWRAQQRALEAEGERERRSAQGRPATDDTAEELNRQPARLLGLPIQKVFSVPRW